MPDEKNGDELFEDLDKFFAPIRDVDWDEPEEPSEPSRRRPPSRSRPSLPPPSRRDPRGLPRTRPGTTPGSSSRSTRSWASRIAPRS